MPNRLNTRPWFVSLIAASLSCGALHLHAQTASEDYSIVNTWLGQGNASVNGSQAVQNNSCVPTSTANGLSYLDAYQLSLSLPSPFTVSPNSYAAVNALQTQMGTTASGTTTSGELNGLQTYLSAPAGANKNPAPSVTLGGQASPAEPAAFFGAGLNAGLNLQNANPTAQFLANALTAHDGVQIGILWGTVSDGNFTYDGGHFVSLTSISLTGGSGTMGILDPWGTSVGNNAGSSAVTETLTVQTVTLNGLGSFLDVTYPITVSGPDDTTSGDNTTQFGANGETGIILVDAIEAVPEPTTLALLTAGSLAVLAVRRRKA